MIAAFVGIPVVNSHVGTARFGVLTLAWAAIGYFGLFDLGLGRALTQAVSAHLGSASDDSELASVTWTALWLMVILGVLGAVTLTLFTPLIVNRGLQVPT